MLKATKDEQVRDAAAEKIFARRDQLLSEQRSVKDQQSALAVREREIDRELAECRAAARFFNIEFEIAVPNREINELQTRMHHFSMRMREAERRGDLPEAEELQQRVRMYQAQLRDVMIRKEREEAQGRLLIPSSTEENVVAQSVLPRKPKMPKMRDIALDRLREAGSVGQKASVIQKYIENTYSVKIHDKTVGMTLYRLSKENLVHRDGQVWFFGSQNERSEDSPESPSASAPGPDQIVLEETR